MYLCIVWLDRDEYSCASLLQCTSIESAAEADRSQDRSDLTRIVDCLKTGECRDHVIWTDTGRPLPHQTARNKITEGDRMHLQLNYCLLNSNWSFVIKLKLGVSTLIQVYILQRSIFNYTTQHSHGTAVLAPFSTSPFSAELFDPSSVISFSRINTI